VRSQNQRRRLLASTMIAGFAAIGMAAPAMAQSTQEESATVSEIVVTGSRIRQANLVTTSPVTQVTAEDVRESGVSRVEDLVTQLPQAFAAQNSTVSNGASGTATVSLRNLGSTRTLVLIDGKRMPYGSPLDAAADLNQIPAQLVERVEVLTGGASAVYGSDAIAGVVNFIMKKDFEGLEITAQYGQYLHHNDYDGPGNLRSVIEGRGATNPSQFQLPDDDVQTGFSREITAIMGVSSPDGKGNITAYAGYRKNNKVLGRDYDYASCSLGGESAGSFTCGGSGTSFPGRFTDFANFNYTLDASGNFIPYSAARDAYNFGPLNYYQRPDERYNLGAMGHYQVNDKIEVFTQLMFSDYQSVAQIAPSGNFGNTATINCDNPLLSASQSAGIGCTPADIAAGTDTDLYILRRNVEGGGRQSHLDYTSYRGVIGMRGDLDDVWSYEVSAQYAKVKLSQIYRNEFSVARLTRALDVVADPVSGAPVCSSVLDGTDPNCVPYNVFSTGGVTQEALDYLQVPLVMTGYTEQQVVTASVTGDLTERGVVSPWASRGLQLALGAEYRRDALDLVTDVTYSTGDGAGQGGPTIGLGGAQSTYDLFGEFQMPIVEGLPFAESITVDGAYRASDYALGGKTDTWKVGMDYAPVSDIRFRASYQSATRAPNVIDLYTAEGFNLFDLDADPCDATSADTYAGNAACIGTNPWQVTLAQANSGFLSNDAGQYNRLQSGTSTLSPEDSETTTFGVVFTPSFLPGLNLSIDYFDIEITNLIQPLGGANIATYCYTLGDLDACNLINRNDNGNFWSGDGYIEDRNTNIGGLATSGIDFVGGYNLPLEDWGVSNWGTIGLSFTGTWLEKLETDTGLDVFDCAGKFGNTCAANDIAASPEWRHRASVSWGTPVDGVNLGLTWRYISAVDLDSGVTTRLDSTLEEQHYFDLNGSWQLRDNVTVRGGVNNILDNDPPLSYSVGTTGNNNTYPQVYDAMGRYAFISMTASF
jgi:iron complex outermembrane recepter protein